MLSTHQVEHAEQLLAGGSSVRQVAKRLGVSRGPVALIAQGRHPRQLEESSSCRPPERFDELPIDRPPRAGDPTPAEIATVCCALRRQRPRHRMAGWGREPWRVAVVSERQLALC